MKYTEFQKQPVDAESEAEWRAALAQSGAVQGMCENGRVLFNIDPKAALCTVASEYIFHPYKAMPAYPMGETKAIAGALFGGSFEDTEEKENKRIFGFKKSMDVLMVSDGRRPAFYSKIVGMLLKLLKLLSGFIKKCPVDSYRMIYSNAEFRRKGCAFKQSGQTRSSAPEPLESFALVFPKGFLLRERSRINLDLDSNTRSKTLSNVPLLGEFRGRPALPPLCRYATKLDILKGVSRKSDEVEDDHFDEMFETVDGETLDGDAVGDTSGGDAAGGSLESNLEKLVWAFNWATCEIVLREYLHTFTPKPTIEDKPFRVVGFFAGPGFMVLAC